MFEGLNCFYFILILIGILYALFILVTGGLSDFGDAIHLPGDLGVGDLGGHGDTGLPALSPITLSSFATAFGAFGIIATQGFALSAIPSLIVAVIGALAIAVIAHFGYFYLLIKPQGSSEITQSDIIGATAEVTTPIPMGGTGEVTFVAQGGLVSYPARSLDRVALPRGTSVTIVELTGTGVAVRARTSFK